MIGETIDRKYKLIRLLGQGGMGSVYEAEHIGTRRRVAVKVIKSHLLAPESGGATRFRREARAGGTISSEHIVEVLDSGADDVTGVLYLVMEYLEGEDLQHLIGRTGPLAPDVALRIAAQALMGLKSAHEAHVVHRDIKPANLFLARRKDGTITTKILDFGIAKITADPLSVAHTTGLTNTGSFLGSPLYMSPEQVVNSRGVDHRADLWSLGSALYYALAGRAPHEPIESVARLIMAICSTPPPSIQEAAPWIPLEIAKVINRALSLKLEDRYPTAAVMLEAIRPLLPGGVELREEMLVPMSAEQRAAFPSAGASSLSANARRIAVGLESTEAIGEAVAITELDAHGRAGLDVKSAAEAAPPTGDKATAQPELLKDAKDKPVVVPDTTPQGHDTSSKAEGGAGPPRTPWGTPRAMVAAGAVLLLGLLAVGVSQSISRPALSPPLGAPATPTAPSPDLPPSVEVPSPPVTSVPAPIRRVRLVILPSDASVEVDGARVEVQNGAVMITGALGSGHWVRVFKGNRKVERSVLVTEEGVEPPKVELPPPVPVAPAAAPRPAPSAPPRPQQDPLMP